MDLIEIAEACLKIGVPMTVLSGLMFSWLHSQGKLDVRLGRKAISAELKKMKKDEKKEKAAAKKDAPTQKNKRSFSDILQLNASPQKQADENADMLYRRWMWFGGGFYGLAALWTFAIVEVLDVLNFIFNFPGISAMLEKGIVALVIELVMNQISNIVSAFVWFTYWSDSIATWVVVAYLGYLLGIELAKRRARG